MPNKPEKWDLKVWCLACYTAKYVWNFEVYCGKETPPPQPGHAQDIPNPTILLVRRGEPQLAHNVVLKMVEGLANMRHLVVMDNFFSSIGLFMDLLGMEFYALGIVRPNHVGLPLELTDTKSFKNVPKAIHYGECMM